MAESMVFYRSFAQAADMLPPEQYKPFMQAILAYGFDEDESLVEDLDMLCKMAWKLIKPQIDANIQRRQNGRKGASYGKLGGRPKFSIKDEFSTKSDELSTKEKPHRGYDQNPIGVTPKTPNVNDNVNVNSNVNDNENEKGNENKPAALSEEEKQRRAEQHQFVTEIVDYLNDKSGKHYRADTPKTLTLIKARQKEGFTLDDFKKVIDTKCAEWKNDDKMSIYLRPETLFSPKFEGYLNQKTQNDQIDWQDDVDRWWPDEV